MCDVPVHHQPTVIVGGFCHVTLSFLEAHRLQRTEMRTPTRIACGVVNSYLAVTHDLGRHPDANFRAQLSIKPGTWRTGLLVTLDYGSQCPLSLCAEPVGTVVTRWEGTKCTLMLGAKAQPIISAKVATCNGGASLSPAVTCHMSAPPSPPPPPHPPMPPPRPNWSSLTPCAKRHAPPRAHPY